MAFKYMFSIALMRPRCFILVEDLRPDILNMSFRLGLKCGIPWHRSAVTQLANFDQING